MKLEYTSYDWLLSQSAFILKGLIDRCAGVVKFDPATGKQNKVKSATKAYTTYFAEALIAEAEVDKNIVGIHAAMGGGTGMNMFAERFSTRCFDVGIAEQHAVTFAAGLACEGLKPFCSIYSSFLQRGYDQVNHLENLYNLYRQSFIDCKVWLFRASLRFF